MEVFMNREPRTKTVKKINPMSGEITKEYVENIESIILDQAETIGFYGDESGVDNICTTMGCGLSTDYHKLACESQAKHLETINQIKKERGDE